MEELLQKLKGAVEATVQEADGTVWGTVYLPNSCTLGRKEAGYLSQATQQGLYRPLGRLFGEVLLSKGSE
jgi:hypothetical protein